MLLEDGPADDMMSSTTTHVGLVTQTSAAGSGGSSMSPGEYQAGAPHHQQPQQQPPHQGPHQGQQESPDTKEGIEELCPVCGDKVSGYHYGLLTCESCKGFFKRTVQNKKVYTCVSERSCHIDKSQRKRCPYCRFQKCLDVGMKLEAVRADRMRGGRNKFGPMYKRDRARKLQLLRQKQLAAHQGRPQCQLGSEAVGGPQALSLNELNSMGSPSSAALYGGSQVQIKQELIQIPQLSSSTSSPDSSSSPNSAPSCAGTPGSGAQTNGPGSQAAAIAAAVIAGPHHQTQAPPGGDHHRMSWTPHTPSTPTSSTPSPHTASPKAFQYEGTGGGNNGAPPATVAPMALHGGGGGGAAAAIVGTMGKVPSLLREIQTSAQDDKEWQSQLFGLLQNQTYNQCEVDLFELMCKVLDQSLFAQVDWARNSLFFKDLKVDDQMKLLQHSWSDMLILDHTHHRLHNNLPDDTSLPNGQKFNLLTLAVLGQPSLIDQFNELSAKLEDLKFDSIDYICLKFLLLLNPDVRALVNRKHIHEALEQVKQALHEYSVNCYPQIQDKFGKLLMLMPEIHLLSLRGEEYLYYKHLEGEAPTQTLLMEMLQSKRK